MQSESEADGLAPAALAVQGRPHYVTRQDAGVREATVREPPSREATVREPPSRETIGGRSGAGARSRADAQPGRLARFGPELAARIGPELAIGAVALLVFGWQVGAPSVWRDEAASLSVAGRSLADMTDAFGHVDLVHAAYYLLAHAILSAWPSATALRLVSVVAFALVAVLLVRIGRVLGALPVGVAAAGLTVVSPLASRYAQDARPFALATLAATWSLYALLLACAPGRRPTGPGRRPTAGARRPWVVYSVSVVVLGSVNVLALLAVVSHGLIVAGLSASGAQRRAAAARWAVHCAAALAVLGAFLVAAWSQRGQVAWITAPHLYDLTGFYLALYQSRAVVVLGGGAAAIAVLLLWRGLPAGAAGRIGTVGLTSAAGRTVTAGLTGGAGPAGATFLVGAAWAGIAPVLLWAVSQVRPLWDLHYVIFCLPGATLLLASIPPLLLRALRPAPRGTSRSGPTGPVLAALLTATVVLCGAAGLPQQVAYRDAATGHVEDLRGVASYLRANALPGDGIVYSTGDLRVLADVYPVSFRGLDDVALARDARSSGTIAGVEIPPAALGRALIRSSRVWLIRGQTGLPAPTTGIEGAKLAVLAADYRPISSATISTLQISLLVPN